MLPSAISAFAEWVGEGDGALEDDPCQSPRSFRTADGEGLDKDSDEDYDYNSGGYYDFRSPLYTHTAFDYNGMYRAAVSTGGLAAQGRRREELSVLATAGMPVKGDSILGILDDVSDGICSYLAQIRALRKSRIVYDKHEKAERTRWLDCLRLLSEQSESNNPEPKVPPSVASSSSSARGKGSRSASRRATPRARQAVNLTPSSGECPSQPQKPAKPAAARAQAREPLEPALSEDVPPEEGRQAEFGVGGSLPSTCCAPPRSLFFQAPDCLQDGSPAGQGLAFTSCFESGNLAFVRRETRSIYYLYLDVDVNSKGYTQWFYFAVRGGKSGQRVTFRIANMSKGRSLFEQGMRPVVWSERSATGWHRDGANVRYYPSLEQGVVPQEASDCLHTLEFTYTFQHDDDTVFFAYHYPYTWTYMRTFLEALVAHPDVAPFVRRDVLCTTIGGLPCDLLEISEGLQPKVLVGSQGCSKQQQQQQQKGCRQEPGDKPVVVLTARVHPGESNASWMMHGFLHFLCSSAPEAHLLRRSYHWIVVPMLNPDGVVRGNYRCGLAGADLNRTFLRPHRRLHPTIWSLKEVIKGRKVEVYMDLHGHSRRDGIFFYGGKCLVAGNNERNARIRLLPRLCAAASNDFKYQYCNFDLQESKMSTARLVAFMQLGITRAYTIEASFAGILSPSPESGSKPKDNSDSQGHAPSSENTSQDEDAARLCGTSHGTAPTLGCDVAEVEQSCAQASMEVAAEEDDGDAWTDFTPARLQLAGPTIGRAMAAVWLLEKGSPPPPGGNAWSSAAVHATAGASAVASAAEGSEEATWPHLAHTRLMAARAQEELAALMLEQEQTAQLFPCGGGGSGAPAPRVPSGSLSSQGASAGSTPFGAIWAAAPAVRVAATSSALPCLPRPSVGAGPGVRMSDEAVQEEDTGSDSAPSGDEKAPEELHQIHRQIIRRLRQQDAKNKTQDKKKSSAPPVRSYVAFGKTITVEKNVGTATNSLNSERNCFSGDLPTAKRSFSSDGARERDRERERERRPLKDIAAAAAEAASRQRGSKTLAVESKREVPSTYGGGSARSARGGRPLTSDQQRRVMEELKPKHRRVEPLMKDSGKTSKARPSSSYTNTTVRVPAPPTTPSPSRRRPGRSASQPMGHSSTT